MMTTAATLRSRGFIKPSMSMKMVGVLQCSDVDFHITSAKSDYYIKFYCTPHR